MAEAQETPPECQALNTFLNSHPASLATSSLTQEIQKPCKGIWSEQEVMYVDAAHFHSSHLRHFFFRINELRRQIYLFPLQRVLVWNTDFSFTPSALL